ncbi:DUF222 domain-containing protein [Demequina sp.]|uniref:HNH endonuclease n=1 Tax=Demequina sp. TaxID=2050685 RepID=UPI003A8BD733
MAVSTRDIEQLVEQLRALAEAPVSDLDRRQLLDQFDAVARLEKVAGAWSARFAGEIARRSGPDFSDGGLARREGHGDAGGMVSRLTGSSVARARRVVAAGEAFVPVPGATVTADAPAGSRAHPQQATAKYSRVAQASLAGELSVEAAGVVVTGLNTVAPSLSEAALVELEARLVAKAVTMRVHEVGRMVARAVARVDIDRHREQEQRLHAERYLWWKQDHTGMVTFHGQCDAVTAAPIINVLEQMATLSVRAQARPGDGGEARGGVREPGSGEALVEHRTVGQMRLDALFDLARHAQGCRETTRSGVRTSIVVRMSLADLMSGQGWGSIDGINAPVSVPELRRLAGDAGFIPEVLSASGEVLDWGRERRCFTEAQRRALIERDGGCAKCHAPPEHCEAHHIRWWMHGGRTDLSNGVMLCTRCHHDVHRQGWEIEIVGNRVRFIPPPGLAGDGRALPGGDAVFDVDVRGLDPGGDHHWPRVTAEDEAMVLAWAREAWAREDAVR